MTAPAVRRAGLNDLDQLTELFDGYRVYYGQPSDPGRARGFLEQRIRRQESVILVAESNGRAVGFTQLFPSFSSVSTARIWILNDLFVERGARRRGVAAALLEGARAHASDSGAVRLVLETLPANKPAQSLYERTGWVRDGTWHYVLELSSP